MTEILTETQQNVIALLKEGNPISLCDLCCKGLRRPETWDVPAVEKLAERIELKHLVKDTPCTSA